MDEDQLEVGDRVKVPLPKMDIYEESKYIFGTVKDFKYGGSVVEVELSQPYKGSLMMDTPTYVPKKITSAMFTLGTWKPDGIGDNPECSHSWEITGASPNTGETWYNCKSCKIKREDI